MGIGSNQPFGIMLPNPAKPSGFAEGPAVEEVPNRGVPLTYFEPKNESDGGLEKVLEVCLAAGPKRPVDDD